MALLFTVVVPLYNKEKYIVKCIDSVLRQTYREFELVVVDDGSSDGSLTLVKNFDDERLRIIEQDNAGVSAARNTGILYAQGKYVAFLDADDWYEKDYLKEIVLLMKNFPNCDAYATGYFRHRNLAKNDTTSLVRHQPEQYIVEDFYRDWAKGAFFCASSCTVKVDYFTKMGKFFPIGEAMGEDQEIWFHIAENGVIAYSKKCMANYNQGSGGSLTQVSLNTCELPFVTRLKGRLDKKELGFQADSALMFVEKYELERSINNAIQGNKVEAIRLFWRNRKSKSWIKYKVMVLVLIILPNTVTTFARYIRAKHVKTNSNE